MPVVPLQCPLCAGMLQIDSAWGGEQVGCPHCQGAIVLPPEAALLSMASSPPAETATTLHCPVCTGPFQVVLANLEQQVCCPHCGHSVLAPAFSPTAAPPPNSGAPSESTTPPPGIDELLPPGAEWSSPAAPAAFARSQAPQPQRADERFPPGFRPTAASPPRGASAPATPPPVLPPEDHRFPPRQRPPKTTPPDRDAVDRLSRPARERPETDDLLPPRSSADSAVVSEPRFPPESPPVEALLPPGAADAPPAPPAPAVRTSVVDALLPPGAEGSEPTAAAPRQQVPIPAAPRRLPPVPANLAPGAALVPTAGGGYVTIQASPKVIGSGDDEVEIRRVAPEEKSRRRLRKSVLLWAFCILILIVVFYFLTR